MIVAKWQGFRRVARVVGKAFGDRGISSRTCRGLNGPDLRRGYLRRHANLRPQLGRERPRRHFQGYPSRRCRSFRSALGPSVRSRADHVLGRAALHRRYGCGVFARHGAPAAFFDDGHGSILLHLQLRYGDALKTHTALERYDLSDAKPKRSTKSRFAQSLNHGRVRSIHIVPIRVLPRSFQLGELVVGVHSVVSPAKPDCLTRRRELQYHPSP